MRVGEAFNELFFLYCDEMRERKGESEDDEGTMHSLVLLFFFNTKKICALFFNSKYYFILFFGF